MKERIIINGVDNATQKRMADIRTYEKAMKAYKSCPDKFTSPSDKAIKWMNKSYKEMLTKLMHFIYKLAGKDDETDERTEMTGDAVKPAKVETVEPEYQNVGIKQLVAAKVEELVARGRVADAKQIRDNLIRNGQHKLFICTRFEQIHRDVCVALRAFDNIIDKRMECLGCRAAGKDRAGAECHRCNNNYYPEMNFVFKSDNSCKQCSYKGAACYQCKEHWTEDRSMLPTIEVFNPYYSDKIFVVHDYDEWMKIQDQFKNSTKLDWESKRISAEYAQLLKTSTPWLRLGCVPVPTLEALSKFFTCKEAFIAYCAGIVDSINQLGTWDLDLTETETIVDGNAIYWGFETGTGYVPSTDAEYGDQSYETHDGKWKHFTRHELTANKVPATGNINTEGIKLPSYPVDDNFFVADTALGKRTLMVCSGTRQFRKYEVAECDVLKAFLQMTFYVAAGFKPLVKLVEVPDEKYPGFTKVVPQRGDYLFNDEESRLVLIDEFGEEVVEDGDVDTGMDCDPFSDDDNYYDKQQVMSSTPIYQVQPTVLKQYSNARGDINPDVKFELTGIN